ncbi:MAG: FecR family protein [Bacteroidales bacterium]|jgi:ferric-dicitrate binding protein FerR (iron transport regulator)|nr:FecR family protein [Bacteroidales bacterium]
MLNHSMSKGEIKYLLAGFFSGELREDELKRLHDKIESDAVFREEFNRWRSAWILAHHEAGKEKFAKHPSWRQLRKRAAFNAGHSIAFLRYLTPMRYAASLLLCLATGAITATALLYRSADAATTVSPASTVVKAPLGAKSNIILPDGSVVWLNAGSTIEYTGSFGIEKRELFLSGEAFFEVKSDSLKPFNVYASGMTVRALGTRFNVKAYPEDHISEATLEEGKVDVLILSSTGKLTQSVSLKPKEQLLIRRAQEETQPVQTDLTPASKSNEKIAVIKEIILIPDVQTELSTSWKDKKWIISDEPLETLAIDLERRYNLNIRFESEELKTYKFTGTIEKETVEQVLTALSLTAPLQYAFDKNNVALSLNKKDKAKFNKVLKNKR